MKQCRLNEERIRADKAADALLKSGKEFWKEIKRQSVAKLPRAPTVGDSHCDADIADDFASIYKNTFNCVNSSDADVDFINNAFSSINESGRASVHVSTVSDVIKNLTKGKAAGDDGIYPEHLIYASRRLHTVLFFQ